jgi:prepilin-type N-terminal cleavage/methylation domain-containing protein
MKIVSGPQKKGFTLLEILLVIAAIGILAAIVLIAINPNRQLAQARNAQRQSDVLTISNAVYQKIIDDANFVEGLPTSVTYIDGEDFPIVTGDTFDKSNIFTLVPVAQADVLASCFNLSALITENYIADMPQDPTNTDTTLCSGYTIVKNTNNRITIEAPFAELDADISITR